MPVDRPAPDVIVFDVNETLSDMAPLAGAFERVGLDAGAAEAWFAGVLRDGFALTVVGENPAFADLAADALRVRLAAAGATGTAATSAVEAVMGAFASLVVHPDVVDGVRALRATGTRLVTLSNGSADVARGLLERAGLAHAFDALLSVEDAPAWKPHPASYAAALTACSVPADRAMLVAVHPWDVDGAARAGLRTAWLNRKEAPYPAHFRRAEVEVTDLVGLARAIGGSGNAKGPGQHR
jgi:2-haloacid dehalogenase